mmetsp:Transcript_59919/g.106585  ORF Transcript_59919/g.106585 Transcript_59919/m.106585 type:complete len:595 (+) Transcript_59919:48-1832(+)
MAPQVEAPPGLGGMGRGYAAGRGRGRGGKYSNQYQERSGPPGARKAKNGAIRSLDAASEEACSWQQEAESRQVEDMMVRVSEEVRQAVVQEVDSDVYERLHQVWKRGALDAKQLHLQNEQNNEQLMQTVANFKSAQDCLEAENRNLRHMLTALSDQFSLIEASGAVKHLDFGNEPCGADCSTPSTCATPSAGGVFGPPGLGNLSRALSQTSSGVVTPGGSDSGALSAPSSGDPLSLADALAPPPGLGGRAPEVPPFPFPQTGTPSAKPATLSLADALGFSSPKKEEPPSSAPQTPVRKLPSPPRHAAPSVLDFEEAPDAFVFGLTLRVADGADLGLGLSSKGWVLRIDSVKPGGAAHAWNRQCSSSGAPDRVLRTGDQVVSVNDISGNTQAMIAECSRTKLLRLQLVRASGGASTPAPSTPAHVMVHPPTPGCSPPPKLSPSHMASPPPASPPPEFAPSASPPASPPPPPPSAPPSFAAADAPSLPPQLTAGGCEFVPASFPSAPSPQASPMHMRGTCSFGGPPSSPPPLSCPPALLAASLSASEPPPPPSCPPGLRSGPGSPVRAAPGSPMRVGQVHMPRHGVPDFNTMLGLL